MSKNKENDLFEKAFGKKPKKGYKFTGLGYSFGYRSIIISWTCKGIGFGQLALIFDDTGLAIDSELMTNEFIISALNETIKRIKKGQKADKWIFSKVTKKGRCVESQEGHEQFISAMCSTFLWYMSNDIKVLKIT
jgi:hypothetical protein